MKKLRRETGVEDAFLVERTVSGRCTIKRAFDSAAGPSCAALWGAVARLVFLNANLDRAIPKGGSALFILLKSAAETRVLTAVKPYRARILRTSLPQEDEQRLKAEFTKAA
jgi:uncharacterized membrane protein